MIKIIENIKQLYISIPSQNLVNLLTYTYTSNTIVAVAALQGGEGTQLSPYQAHDNVRPTGLAERNP